MTRKQAISDPDHSQARAVPVRARSQASREAIVQAALALWRTAGFADTTVTDICRAAGVSKALFYVYFARREDVLAELEVFARRDARRAAQAVASRPYELRELIAAVIGTLESEARRFPPELVFEAVMETYRMERRALAGGATDAEIAVLFLEPFQQAARDGKLRAGTDAARAARAAQVLVADGIRSWAARGFPGPLAAQLAAEISALVGG
jgi:AcrR family transcriptional regulator